MSDKFLKAVLKAILNRNLRHGLHVQAKGHFPILARKRLGHPKAMMFVKGEAIHAAPSLGSRRLLARHRGGGLRQCGGKIFCLTQHARGTDCQTPIQHPIRTQCLNLTMPRQTHLLYFNQQMQWSQRGAHLLLQIRTRVLNEEW